jgi:hypothetical protein
MIRIIRVNFYLFGFDDCRRIPKILPSPQLDLTEERLAFGAL